MRGGGDVRGGRWWTGGVRPSLIRVVHALWNARSSAEMHARETMSLRP